MSNKYLNRYPEPVEIQSAAHGADIIVDIRKGRGEVEITITARVGVIEILAGMNREMEMAGLEETGREEAGQEEVIILEMLGQVDVWRRHMMDIFTRALNGKGKITIRDVRKSGSLRKVEACGGSSAVQRPLAPLRLPEDAFIVSQKKGRVQLAIKWAKAAIEQGGKIRIVIDSEKPLDELLPMLRNAGFTSTTEDNAVPPKVPASQHRLTAMLSDKIEDENALAKALTEGARRATKVAIISQVKSRAW